MGIYNARKYRLRKNLGLRFILDSNIWLYLYSDLHEDRVNEIDCYSNLLQEIIDNNYSIYLTSGIISEISNVLIRADYKKIKDETNPLLNFKRDYVNSDQYKAKVEEVNGIVDSILSIENLILVNDKFDTLDITKISQGFLRIDWNDCLIYELSKIYTCKLITHDRDFERIHDHEIDVVRYW